MKRVMIDLETMGTRPDAAIVAIGAVEFDPQFMENEDGRNFHRGKLGRTFYRVVDLQSSIEYGGTVDGSTMYWWLQQSEEARRALFFEPNKTHICAALVDLSDWFKEVEGLEAWAHGDAFDIAILNTAYRDTKIDAPWAYSAGRDTRSVFDTLEWWPNKEEIALARLHSGHCEHHALGDAITEAKTICEGYHQKRVRFASPYPSESNL